MFTMTVYSLFHSFIILSIKLTIVVVVLIILFVKSSKLKLIKIWFITILFSSPSHILPHDNEDDCDEYCQ